jgi:PAS domain S-box-containing protein
VFSSIADAVIVTDERGRVRLMNTVAEELTGWKTEEASQKNIEEVFRVVDEDSLLPRENPVSWVLREGRITSISYHTLLLSRTGKKIPIDDSGAAIRDDTGDLIGAVLVFRDITERRKSEAELETTQERLRLAMDAGNMGVWDWSIETGELRWIGNLERLHGVAPGGAPKNFDEFKSLIHPDDVKTLEKNIQESLANKSHFSTEFRVIWADGAIRWIGGLGRAYYNDDGKPVRMVGVGIDLNERKLSEETIASQLRQKEILLKEVHHRVKNNLQIISSLLSLQSLKSGAQFRELLVESRNRIQSMALIHEKLYQARDISRINLGEYIGELAVILYSSFGVETSRIKFNIDSDGALADIDTAIPCGLIANEIISNSLKHGFPDQRSGRIDFKIKKDSRRILFEASDNGVGLGPAIKLHDGPTLGLKLIWNLVAQLKGTIDINTNAGTAYTMYFPQEPHQEIR